MTDTSDSDGEQTDVRAGLTRRRVLASTAALGATSLAGCLGGGDGGDGGAGEITLADFRGSGPLVDARGQPGGTSIEDLPDLSGELNFYLGGGEGGLYLDLIELFSDIYPDFSFGRTLDSSRSLANKLGQEAAAGVSPADVFISVDAGSLGQVADADGALELPSEVTSEVPESLRTNQWVGIAGRARAVPYNTDQLSESDIPDTVRDFPQTSALADGMGWAPTYSAFQSFVTAMRLIRGEDATRQWLNDMLDHGVESFDNEFRVSNQVANGALTAGFANHYYAMRVRNQRQNAPIELTFTSGDAGALINVSGAQIVNGTDNQELAENFLRHLLSAEAQEFFATRTFAYPTVPDVAPVGDLPTIDELNPPDVDLSELSDTGPTLALLDDVGLL
ncbi:MULTISPECIES: extracellular solute-binding protein [Salinibaculum]|uniref:extracellular solute-binding protein n=1 Tax=Salinibaculum TaxID=2732368 RepID=UPI0030CBAF9C